MKRDLRRLADETYDLVVVGGGVMGLAAAREAASRGLSVALVEKGDFGGATSANSLKLIHGGLRYLQHADIRRLRQSVRERLAFMRAAPHLVHPLPFLVPTYGHTAKGKEAMTIAFLLYRLLAFDRNATGDPEKEIPPGRTLSAAECLATFPGFSREGLTGGAVFHDGQAYNTERLTLSFALGAAEQGAVLANYVRADGFLREGDRVNGVRVLDLLGGAAFDLQAKVVLNAAGPWADTLLGVAPGQPGGSGYLLAKAVNLVVPRLLSPTHAVGLECRAEKSDALVGRGGRLFFITPWRGASLIGTTYHTWRDDPDALRVTGGDIREIIDAINGAWPAAALREEEVTFHHLGLVPTTAPTGPSGANLAKADRIIDHRNGGLEGLVSLIGVKYTTARDLAQRAVDLIAGKIGRPVAASLTAMTPLPGGKIGRFNEFMAEALRQRPAGLDERVVRHLVYSYGSDYPRVLSSGDGAAAWRAILPGSVEVLRAEVLHAVREEMAVKLSDVVLRRTDLGSLGSPGEECLKACAGIMAAELGWDGSRIAEEIAAARAAFTVEG